MTTQAAQPLNVEEMTGIRALIVALHNEIHHPGAFASNGARDFTDLENETNDALQRLNHSIGR